MHGGKKKVTRFYLVTFSELCEEYSGRNITLSLDDHYKYTWEGGEDREAIAHTER
jgi:hypothetical protein